MNKYVLIYIIIFLVHFIRSNDLLYKRLNKTIHEIEAINIIKQSIYARETISNLETLELIYKRNWIKASRLFIDFLVDNSKPETSKTKNDNSQPDAQKLEKPISSVPHDSSLPKLEKLRILFAGTRQCGKTSMITRLCYKKFDDDYVL